jgi:branched-chain amino acid transport system substrate-binding protein
VVPSYDNLAVPSVREYRELMTRHHPVPPASLAGTDYVALDQSFVGFEGFLNAKLLVEVLTRLGDHPQRADVAAAVAGIRRFDLGMGAPISFSPQRNQGSDAIYYTTVRDGRFVTVQDWAEWAK